MITAAQGGYGAWGIERPTQTVFVNGQKYEVYQPPTGSQPGSTAAYTQRMAAERGASGKPQVPQVGMRAFPMPIVPRFQQLVSPTTAMVPGIESGVPVEDLEVEEATGEIVLKPFYRRRAFLLFAGVTSVLVIGGYLLVRRKK